MKLVACLLTCLSLFAQTPTAIQRRGTEVLTRERNRGKANLCANAGPTDLGIGECYLTEGKVTNENYAEYVRVIAALLQLPHKDLDAAEATWLTYREQTCRAMIHQWEGGTMGRIAYPQCLLTVTWNHMNELAGLYSDLWQ
jgi:uncharacterized protein YecT (DUF1311 family)